MVDAVKTRPIAATNSHKSIASAQRLRQPFIKNFIQRFQKASSSQAIEITKNPNVARFVRSRPFQFLLILPNQIIFWTVIIVGLIGTVIPGLNFATAITWYIWFCVVFVLMVVIGRAWCAMCPFGGFAEWVQRKTLWKRLQKSLGLGIKVPQPITKYGLITSVIIFILVTYVEEYYNIAGPGVPHATSWLVVGIVTSALIFFLVFERRSFCRYFCPLSALIGTIGSTGSVAGFRTKDRQLCAICPTKDCMRGGTEGYGCPWYTWPGSAESNALCGLCSECYKACPYDNVGLFAQKPLSAIVNVHRRRMDIALGVALLWGLVLFQQINATNTYNTVDNWLNSTLHFPQYPNPVDYFGIIGAVTVLMLLIVGLIVKAFESNIHIQHIKTPNTFIDRITKFRSIFMPLMYGLIPVVGADYFARQLPKFFKHAPRLVPAIEGIFGFGSTHSPLYTMRILSNTNIIIAQVVVIGLGTLASIWAVHKIFQSEPNQFTGNRTFLRLAGTLVALACGIAAGYLYVIMQAAS